MESRSYELIEELGRGAAATVYRGRDRGTGREYAVKVLHEEHMGHSKAVARFLQERSILLSLRHDNIVRVHDLLSTQDRALALVMDLVTGGNLRDYLAQRGTLPIAEAAGLLAQVSEGLAAAHAQSVVHRDLKPDNVLVDRDLDGNPRVRLTDFGIARILDTPGMTTPGAVVGTPNYMAPEVIQGLEPTPAVDVYALGMMFYELLLGRPPYADSLQSTILMRHLGGAPCRRAGIPKSAWSVITACTAREPGRRPAAAALADWLRQLAADTEGVPALPVLPEGVTGRTPFPRRAIATSLACVALLAAVVIGFGGRYLANDRGGDDTTSGRANTGPAPTAPPAGIERLRRRYTCRDLLFTDVAPERTCGPFDLKPERGHRYVVVLSWKYSEISEIPGDLVRGDVVNW